MLSLRKRHVEKDMDHRIPLKKQSKKTQKEFYKAQRKIWSINPVSRVVKNKKHDEKVDANVSLVQDEED